MAKRIARKPLTTRKRADIISVAPSPGWIVNLSNEGEIEANYLRHLDQGELILREFNIFLRDYRQKRAMANVILGFLRSVASQRGAVSEVSLGEYKKILDKKKGISLSTKYQNFNHHKNFVKVLMAADVIDSRPLPKAFPVPDTDPKPSFSDALSYDLYTAVRSLTDDVSYIEKKYGLDTREASALAFCTKAMGRVHEISLEKIERWEGDFDFVDRIIDGIDSHDAELFSCVQDFNQFGDTRNVEEALKILHAKFGWDVPSGEHWPSGLDDFLKIRDWSRSRVRSAFARHKGAEADTECLEVIFGKMAITEHENLREVEIYSKASVDSRTVELAFQVLHSKFGRFLPAADAWPVGVADYMKQKGWGVKRIQGALFPNLPVVGKFIVALLSHPDIAPNVDSAAFYTYLDSFKPAFDSSGIDIFIGKERGESIEDVLPKDDPCLQAMMKHAERMKTLLLANGHEELLMQEQSPLFLTWSVAAGRESKVKVIDRSSTPGCVRGFIKDASFDEPLLNWLVKINITGESFRPTHALMMRLSGHSMFEIQGVLRHKNVSTTERYAQRAETQAVLKRKYMDFQESLFESARSSIARTGDGYLCDSHESLDRSPCGDLEMCFECDAQRVVLTSVELAREWLAWSEHIQRNENRLKFNNISRWEKHWLPRLAEYQALIEGAPKKVIEEAKRSFKDISLPRID